MSIPAMATSKNKKRRPGHTRKTSDITRKLQQYQRDMGDAHHAASVSTGMSTAHSTVDLEKPSSPRILPLGSPGEITPFELEEERDFGYMDVRRARGTSLISSSLEREREREREAAAGGMMDGASRGPQGRPSRM